MNDMKKKKEKRGISDLSIFHFNTLQTMGKYEQLEVCSICCGFGFCLGFFGFCFFFWWKVMNILRNRISSIRSGKFYRTYVKIRTLLIKISKTWQNTLWTKKNFLKIFKVFLKSLENQDILERRYFKSCFLQQKQQSLHLKICTS